MAGADSACSPTSSTLASNSRPTTPSDPALTQKAVANIRNTLYQPGPYGMLNNDDLGANSSAFIWEMLGMYPENAGYGTLVFASPAFPLETIHLSNGHAIHITAPGASPSTYYVSSLALNGAPYSKLWVGFERLAEGVSLNFTLGKQPTQWGSAAADAPPSYTSGLRPVVGFLSGQNLKLMPGSGAILRVGAQNATRSRQRVRIVLSTQAGSRLSIEPANEMISLPPNGRETFPVTVHAATTAPSGTVWLTAKLATDGASIQTVRRAAVVDGSGAQARAVDQPSPRASRSVKRH